MLNEKHRRAAKRYRFKNNHPIWMGDLFIRGGVYCIYLKKSLDLYIKQIKQELEVEVTHHGFGSQGFAARKHPAARALWHFRTSQGRT